MAQYLSIQDAFAKGPAKFQLGLGSPRAGQQQIQIYNIARFQQYHTMCFQKEDFEPTWAEIDHLQVEASIRITGDIKRWRSDRVRSPGKRIRISRSQRKLSNHQGPIS